MTSIKVFISSVMDELEEERAIVEVAVSELDLLPNRFEAWPAGPRDPRATSVREVADSEIFILILGSSISPAVLAEYEAARQALPDRILAFVKKTQRSREAETLLTRLRQECVYKTYKRPEQLASKVKKAIRSLMRDLLRHRDEPELAATEEVIREEVVLGPGEEYTWEVWLERGDYLNGIVDEVDGEPLDVYLMNRTNYVNRKNGRQFEYFGEERVGAFEFEGIYVDVDDVWYLVIRNPARAYDREVRVELSRLSFS